MASVQNIACGGCGTTVSFNLSDGGPLPPQNKEILKGSGTGDPPSGLLSAPTKQKTCPSCGSTVWIKYKEG